MTKPTLLVLAPTPYFSDRGCHIRIFEELKLIAKLGYQVELVTYFLGRDLGTAHIHRTTHLPWYRKTSAGPAFSKLLLDLLLLVKAWRVAKKVKPSLIHAHLHESAWIAWLLSKRFRIPVVLDLQGSLVAELKLAGGIWMWLAPLCGWYERWCMHSAKVVIASTNKIPGATVVADGASESLRSPVSKQYDLVYSGGTGTAKGTDVLFEALALVAAQRPIKMLLITPQQPASLPAYITWQSHVAYEDLLPTLAQANIGVDPKPIESTEGSAKLLNYLAAGLHAVTLTSTEPTAEGLAEAVLEALDGHYQTHQLTLWQDQLPLLTEVYERALR